MTSYDSFPSRNVAAPIGVRFNSTPGRTGPWLQNDGTSDVFPDRVTSAQVRGPSSNSKTRQEDLLPSEGALRSRRFITTVMLLPSTSDEMFWRALNLSNSAYQSGETACSHAPYVRLVDIMMPGRKLRRAARYKHTEPAEQSKESGRTFGRPELRVAGLFFEPA